MMLRTNVMHRRRKLILIILQFCFFIVVAESVSCTDYSGGQYTDDFCTSIACQSHCLNQPNVESCMESHYVSAGYCTKENQSERGPSVPLASTPSTPIVALGVGCWAYKSWSDTTCARCPKPQKGQCPSFHWTKCFPTEQDCINSRGGNCWATKSWSDSTCARCPNPQQGQCPSFHWTKCFPTEQDCINSSGSNCKKICRKNTLGLQRPTFKGPSCYNVKYGPQFGPNWVPTGKTRFEHYVKTPTQLYVITQTTHDDLPWLKNHWHPAWNLDGCDAAAAVYENIVCAIELITKLDKTFDGPHVGNRITDFLSNGDEQTNLRELAAFFSQAWKEVARLQVWEEAPSTGYADCTVYPCGNYRYYQGRGPVQLSWNYNYGPFSQWFFNDKWVLLNDPDQVDPEGPMGFIAYFWFWFTPRDFTSGKPISGRIRMRDAIVHWTDGKMNGIYHDGKDYDSVAGLGLSTNVVNGGVECSKGSDGPLWRIMYFLTTGARLGVKIPNMNDADGCRKDKFCNGLFSGCTASAAGASCHSSTDSCGPRYVNGWTGKLCTPRSLEVGIHWGTK